MKRSIIFYLVLFLTVQLSSAQTTAHADTLVGLAVNAKGRGIKNIPVTAKSREGVFKSNNKGIFVIPNVSLYDTLTMIVPKNKIFVVPASGMSFIKIVIHEDKFMTTEAREEILDTGYGQTPKSRSTSGSAVISGDELRQTGQNDILQALAGKVPGIRIVYLSDGTQTVSMRGGTSPTLDNSPVFVVDGIIVENLRYVNINDVQQVTVMKEASIYGARGANGAILVKTK